jgi:hypothetical protein
MRREGNEFAAVAILRAARELADFLEAAGIKQARDALAHGELAFGMVARDRLRPAARLGHAAATVDLVYFR